LREAGDSMHQLQFDGIATLLVGEPGFEFGLVVPAEVEVPISRVGTEGSTSGASLEERSSIIKARVA
jgi:hypothetical protein